MRDNVEAFIGNGGHVAFLSANTCWWQVRFENNNRRMVCYKSDERPNTHDPILATDPARATVVWSDSPVLRPENSMTGVSFRNGGGWWGGPIIPERRIRGYTVTSAEHWLFDGTGLSNGDVFGQGTSVDTCIIGYETDAAEIVDQSDPPVVTGNDGTPRNFLVLAAADLTDWPGSDNVPPGLSPSDQQAWLNWDWGRPGYAMMGIYHRKGTVFTAGTILWGQRLEPR